MFRVRRPRLPQTRQQWRRLVTRVAAFTVGWAVVAVPVAVYGFLHDSRTTVVASHEATVSPTLDGWATLDLGAYLPNVRYPTTGRFGVHIEVGKTNLDSYEQLLDRYALIASQPEGQIAKVGDLVTSMVWSNALIGAVVGLTGPVLWMLLGERRRRELWRGITPGRVAVAGGTAVGLVALVVVQPWSSEHQPQATADAEWRPIDEFVTDVSVPSEAQALQVQGGLITTGTRRLVESAIDTYRKSKEFYADLADEAPALSSELRQPEEEETVALVVSDRHDNVGMDQVARAIGDAGGASILFDAGDDTSTGETWEAFSLDSVAEHFEDYERYVALGNHDEGSFVGDYLDEKGFTVLQGDPVTSEDGIVLLGAPDPRSSGLGNWRVETGLTLVEQEEMLADAACASRDNGVRISTMLVHDTSLGEDALDRGCVDLVLGGHLHSQIGPDAVLGPDGEIGYRYVNGTTGGAAYAIALGSKLRRDAQVTLVTYREGRPIGLQAVDVITTGRFQVQPYVDLALQRESTSLDVPADSARLEDARDTDPPPSGRAIPTTERRTGTP